MSDHRKRGCLCLDWPNLPGFLSNNRRRYRHQLLPGWEYARDEIRSELIPDEALAKRGERPKGATR